MARTKPSEVINKNSIWIADLGTSVEDEINLVPLNENNVDLGWPYFEGEFAHQPFYNASVDSITQKSPIFSERIGGLIGGHFLKIGGKEDFKPINSLNFFLKSINIF